MHQGGFTGARVRRREDNDVGSPKSSSTHVIQAAFRRE